MTSHAKPLPQLDGPERLFWEGVRQREIRVQACLDCGRLRFPASRYCSDCRSEHSQWRTVEPLGEIESFCVFHKAYFPGFSEDVPYTVIQVRLTCGIRLFSNPVGAASQPVEIGMPVRAVFDDVTDEVTLLKFEPVSGKAP
jgi:uncharacterized protein